GFFLDSRGRNNNHKKKTNADASTSLFTESDGTYNDANLLKKVVLPSVDEPVAMEAGAEYPYFIYTRGNEVDVVVSVESIKAVSDRFGNSAYGFFLGKRVAYPVVANYVKLHGVPITVFREDGLSVIATKLGTLIMLDSYTADMCLKSWGRSSYAIVVIEFRANVELKDVTPPKSQLSGIPLGVLLHSIKYKLHKTTLSEMF
nr:hypothetical protein [Tanacetum cinerariifolium]